MKTSTEIDSIANRTDWDRTLELVAEAGFDCWDFSLFKMGSYDWKTGERVITGHPLETRKMAIPFAEKMRKKADALGIKCNQSHAPFPVCCKEIKDLLPLALECTAIAGGEICVIHPDNNKTPEENAEMYLELLPIAHKLGVKIATENMWNWNSTCDCAAPAACSDGPSFKKHIDIVNDPYLVACVDIGHAEMKGLDTGAESMLRELGPRVKALHLHDNDKRRDLHRLPFSMDIDFVPVVRALKDIGYDGVFTLESSLRAAMEDMHTEDPLTGVKAMYAATRKLADMYEQL
ncbi:MAG: sugar phosphate isomerase/epimerase [Clostridia bacterium]|nr:sugar phosphate isomerase/epimerase [Clostridia bacterium]